MDHSRLQDPVFYAHTKFWKDVLTWQRNSTSSSNVDALNPLGPSYISSCIISAKSNHRQPSYRHLTALLFVTNFVASFVPTDLRVGGTHPHPDGTARYAHHRSLTSFLEFQKSLSSKWRRSKKE